MDDRNAICDHPGMDKEAEERATGALRRRIKAELAKALGLPDYSFIVVNVLPDAMKLLRAWRETEVRNAVNAAGGKH